MQSPPQLEEGYFGQFGMKYKMISLGLNRKIDNRRLFSLGDIDQLYSFSDTLNGPIVVI